MCRGQVIRDLAAIRMETVGRSEEFKFDISKACGQIVKDVYLPDGHPLTAKRKNPLKKSRILAILTELICKPECCLQVATCCRPILHEIVGTAIFDAVKNEENNPELAYALSILATKYPYLSDAIEHYFSMLKDFKYDKDVNESKNCLLVKAYYNLLLLNPNRHFELVDWKLVTKLLKNSIQNFSAIKCVALAARYCDLSCLIPHELLEQCLNEKCNIENSRSDDKPPGQMAISTSTESDYYFGEIFFTSNDIRTNLVPVAGVLLPRKGKLSSPDSKLKDFVVTEGSLKNLQSLAFAIMARKPVLLEGQLGAGKTSLLDHFSLMMGRAEAPDILKLQLGDQTDSKSMLGIYVCTETPGEFKWQPGTLTKAVKNGSWLILEDIDSAPLDVISVLIPLLEGKPLSIPGQSREVIPSPGFQIFMTRRIHKGFGGSFQQNAPSKSIEHLCSKIHLESLTKDELLEIVCRKHSHLEPLAEKLIDVYSMVSRDLNLTSTNDTALSNLPTLQRNSTSRDFFKWCRRLAELFQSSALISVNNEVFQEAFSCFCIPVGNLQDRLMLAQAIGAKLGVTKDKVEFYVLRNKGNVQQTHLTFSVGRAALPKSEMSSYVRKNLMSTNYAFTRHSLNLLEQIAVCVFNNEPVLLVGETGCGKTSTIQYLASQCGHRFDAINMSQQSDVTDLLGGFKPVDFKQIIFPLRRSFEDLFVKTFSQKQNVKFLGHIQHCFAEKKWEILLKLMSHCKRAALKRKGLKKDMVNLEELMTQWVAFGLELKKVMKQLHEEHSLAFAFIEGTLIKAVKNGDWILLDEINLATAETLECLSGLMESKSGSLVLVERGDAEPVRRHENFRLFACMNPATDIGKKDLPFGIRNRFTEIYVDELNDVADLKVLVSHYLQHAEITSKLVDGIVRFYQLIQQEAKDKLTDGTGHRPHYSLRTLCRALEFVARSTNMILPKAIYEGFCLSFLTQLDRSSHPIVEVMIRVNILGHLNNVNSLLSRAVPCPGKPSRFSQIEGYWIELGETEVAAPQEYVLTASVRENLRDLARVVSGRNYPVLLQGETSVGKTSLITYLAKSTGNQCVRINNHEHTDIQEYIGCYSADENGRLVFKDGLLVDAMRKGYWIILDELNLAPTDVLEALNRLLDDNRELFIAETQETVKAHSKFMLFATQNPPGQYGGRKILSRAFRNRFVELHFDEIPSEELQIILHKRCHLPRSYCSKFVAVMQDLQTRRKSSGIFAGKHGFITLRDLFRWAERYRQTPTEDLKTRFYDWDQHIAEDGYMLLAGRCRKPDEATVIQETIERILKRKINLESLYRTGSLITAEILQQVKSVQFESFEHLVWTSNLQRMAALVGRAIQFNEPVLLVGETGCGKTTICQLFSALRNTKLFSVNCHMHTESSDFIGGLRPVRQRDQESEEMRLFDWVDGPLVTALKEGSSFLIDEISLADDSVLERLNSVLETDKTLVIAEKGGSGNSDGDDIEVIVADPKFRLLATMNPGGDFGKKELSPALRNRFTEIWCPQSENREDFVKIIEHNINVQFQAQELMNGNKLGEMMVDFVEWFKKTEPGQRVTISIRDFLSWTEFVNTTCAANADDAQESASLSPQAAFIHGAFLVFVDAIGSGSSWSGPNFSLDDARKACLSFLTTQVAIRDDVTRYELLLKHPLFFGIAPFVINRGPLPPLSSPDSYSLTTKTTSENTLRLLRGLQLARPILLEGSPGVGKTSLVTALARHSGHQLTRINLSEQTDVTDLFGADLPIEGGKGGQFAWRDGPFLKALKQGHWIVLDELNLASQSVLEGLNACFDHRGEIFVPELGKSFKVQQKTTRIFACQNPLSQGGGRKGLPKSFLNRFTKVYIEPLKEDDLLFIINAAFPNLHSAMITKMIQFNAEMQWRTMVAGEWGRKGSPWEFNVRDILRWCELIARYQDPNQSDPSEFLDLIYSDRMRTIEDRQKVYETYSRVFEDSDIWKKSSSRKTQFSIGSSHVQVGSSILSRKMKNIALFQPSTPCSRLLRKQLPYIESVMKCIEMNWMAMLVGPKACGKTRIVETIAQLTGNTLNTLAMNSNMDTTEMLGGFEQVNLSRHLDDVIVRTDDLICELLRLEIGQQTASLKSQSFSVHVESLLHMKKILMGLEKDDLSKCDKDLSDATEKILEKFLVLDEMLERVNELAGEKGEFISDAAEIRQAFELLKTRFEKEGQSFHAKGQFEWVDGILVEALKRGTWLLIDNVNFCSPSVLDRLNGLLEPNGVLTIDERGVENNDIPRVVPHPNFRLFLAMDPKYGEISRAMRNRGIEIYVIGEEEGLPYSLADKLELVQSTGVNNMSATSKLISIHEKTAKTLQSSVSKMVHASSLTKQIMDRGFTVNEAVQLSCENVYTSTQIDDDSKEKITSVIGAFTDASNFDDIEADNSMAEIGDKDYEQTVTELYKKIVSLPSVAELSQLSKAARMLRDRTCLKWLSNDSKDYQWNTHLFRMFLERATTEDLMARLQTFANEIDDLGLPRSQVEVFKSLILSFENIFKESVFLAVRNNLQKLAFSLPGDSSILSEVSFDLRLNRRMLQDIALAAKIKPEVSALVEDLMFLYNRLELLQNRASVAVIEQTSNTRSRNSLLDLSKKFAEGTLPASKLPHRVVELFHPYFTILSTVLNEAFQKSDNAMPNDLVQKLTFALKWRDRFWRLCSGSQSSRSTPFFKASFAIHWKWILDELNPALRELLQADSFAHLEDLKRLVHGLSSRFNEGLLVNFHEVDNSFSGRPSPFNSQEIFALWSILDAFLQELSISKQLQLSQSDTALRTMFTASARRKRLNLLQCLMQFVPLSLKESVPVTEVTALETEIMMSLEALGPNAEPHDVKMESTVSSSRPISPELLVLYGGMSHFVWLKVLKGMAELNTQASNTLAVPFKWIAKLFDFAEFQETEDLRVIAMIRSFLENVKANQLLQLPPHVLTMARSHFHGLLSFSLQKRLAEISQNPTNGQGAKADDSLNVFSSVIASVVAPWIHKRLSIVSWTNSSPNAKSDPFEWKISVKEIAETQSLLASQLQLQWIHGSISTVLPHELLDGTFQDTLRMLLDLIKSLRIDGFVDADFEKILQDEISQNAVFEILTAKLTKDALKDLPINLTNILIAIGMFAREGFDVLNSHKLGEQDLFMVKVRFLGELMCCIGLWRFLLAIPRNPYDMAEEAKLKCHYFEEEVNEIETELRLRYEVEAQLCGVPSPSLTRHDKLDVPHYTSNAPRVLLLLERREFLIKQISELQSKVALRPNPSQYDALLKDLIHFHDNVTNQSAVLDLLARSNEAAEAKGRGSTFPRNLQRRMKIWISSANQFMLQLTKMYPMYPDIVLPVKWSLTQIMSGFSLSLVGIDWHISKPFTDKATIYGEVVAPEQICRTLAVVPFAREDELTMPSDMASILLSKTFTHGLKVLMSANENRSSGGTARILHLALSNLCFDVMLRGYQSKENKDCLGNVLTHFQNIWLEFSQQQREQEEDADAMYRFRSKSHCANTDEDTVNEKSFRKLFPSFNREFNDLVPKETLDDSDEEEEHTNIEEAERDSSVNDVSRSMSSLNVVQIYKDLRTIVSSDFQCTPAIEQNIVQLFLNGYKEFLSLASLDAVRKDPLIDSQITTSSILFTSLLKKSLEFKATAAPVDFDIYHECNVVEVQKLLPLLGGFSTRVLELLQEYPEHPALIQIQHIIDRILSFPLNQPLMKFLTGLEILLKQSQDWESYASSKVSIKTELQAVTNQIVEWRKLELRCWPTLLQVVEDKFENEARGWCLKVISALADASNQLKAIDGDPGTKTKECAKLIQGFVESSCIGEFAARLELIDVLYKATKEDQPDLAPILWNIHSYYSQFIASVNNMRQNSKSAIEKDLKDFVKIAKWKDVNFYAMKQAADKSHRTLHKFMRKYEEFLASPVRPYLQLGENNGGAETGLDINQKPLFGSVKDLARFLVANEFVDQTQDITTGNEWLSGAAQVCRKLQKKCGRYFKKAKHQLMIESLDEFTGDVITNIKELQSLDVLSLPKEKRANARKHLDLRKRKSLATLFKILTNTGLSYRKGLAIASKEDSDLDVMSTVLESGSTGMDSEQLSCLKRSCHDYFFKCLAKQSALHEALRTPSKELNAQDIARCKGFSDHLYAVVLNQRQNLAALMKNHEIIRSRASNLNELLNRKVEKASWNVNYVPPQSAAFFCTNKLKDLIDMTIYVMKQFRILVKCCPIESSNEAVCLLPEDELPPISIVSLFAEKTSHVLQAVEQIIENCLSRKSDIDGIFNKILEDYSSYLFSREQYKILEDCTEALAGNHAYFTEIENAFLSQRDTPEKSMARSVYLLRVRSDSVLQECKTSLLGAFLREQDGTTEEIQDLGQPVEHLFKSILTCVQDLLTFETTNGDEERKNQNAEDGTDEELEMLDLLEGHIVPGLERNFFSEIARLKTSFVSMNLTNMFEVARNVFDKKEESGSELRLIYPVIDQYSKMTEYFLERLLCLHRTTCKLLYVLTGLFTDLATRGFCIPPEEVESSGEGATEFEDIQGGGMGEGEGMKDVSEQIEDESQLQEAQQEGKEKEDKPDQDRNIPDEEHGIEMSDDFDGRLHDVDPDEERKESDSEEDKEQEEEQPDEKMGQLEGMEEERFDDKFWGDSEDEDENDATDENDKGPGADSLAESELVAKDENDGEQKGKEKKKESEKKEEGSEEINELSQDEVNNEDENSDEAENAENQNNEEREQKSGDDNFPDDLEFEEDDVGEEDTDNQQTKENEEGSSDEVQPDKGDEPDVDNEDDQEKDRNDDNNEDQSNKMDEETANDEREGDAKDEDKTGEDAMENDLNREDLDKKGDEHDILAEPSEKQQHGSNAPNATPDEATAQNQNEVDEQQQQQENQGYGSSQMESGDGQSGTSTLKENQGSNEKKNRKKDYNKSRQDRSLADDIEQRLKRLKTEDLKENQSREKERERLENQASDLYEHVRGDSHHDTQTLDSATAEQTKSQPNVDKSLEDSDVEMDGEEENSDVEEPEKDDMEVVETDDLQQNKKASHLKDQFVQDHDQEDAEHSQEPSTEEPMVAEGSEVQKIDSGFFTSREALARQFDLSLLEMDSDAVRKELEENLALHTSNSSQSSEAKNEAIQRWRKYEMLTSPLAQQLCEQLRLVLEPTMASKLKGDYRTGKRLNMRKVISYIASQFRKDKIWLRRTKKSRRQYQILIAVDDSSSMGDNHSKQLAFESLAVISNALTWLEAGELAVCSFGETTKLLHSFQEPFNEEAGAHILRDFTFEQKKTLVAKMLEISTAFMSKERANVLRGSANRVDTSQLLLIVSDGRGIFLEGKEAVERSVRRAREAGLFIVFIILDNPSNRDSILDIRIPVFPPGGGFPEIKPYIEEFPFPFYMILRDVNSLPTVLSDALRQWFELVINAT